jgi:hypothetical protein
MLRVFLKKLYDLGYSSVDDEIYDLMDSWRLSGNDKGAAVLSLIQMKAHLAHLNFKQLSLEPTNI